MIASRSIQWKASKGTIDKTGLYKAPAHAGTDKVEAVINGVSGQASVTVIDQVDDFQFADQGPVILQPGEEKKLEAEAVKDGKEVILTGDAIDWEIDSQFGEITPDGTIQIREDVPAGTRTTVTAKLGSIERQIELLIGLKEQVIDDYETYPKEGHEVSGFMGGTHQLSGDEAKFGESSLRVDYDSKNGNANTTVQSMSFHTGTSQQLEHGRTSSLILCMKRIKQTSDRRNSAYGCTVTEKRRGHA